MKNYISTRVRQAGLITAIYINRATPGNRDAILLVDSGVDCVAEEVPVSDEYMAKFAPVVGGYYLRYVDDGYESFVPAEVFESGFDCIDPDPAEDGNEED